MKADKLIALLEAYHPSDPDEQSAKTRMLAFAHEHADCFERSCITGHFTGSAWLLSKDGSHALLMHHKKLGIWVQPGGHADGNPDLLDVALKEAREESGITAIEPVSTKIWRSTRERIFDIDVHHIPASKTTPEHDHYDVSFLLQVQSDEPLVQNDESHELRWITKDGSMLPTTERSVVRMFEKWVKGVTHESV